MIEFIIGFILIAIVAWFVYWNTSGCGDKEFSREALIDLYSAAGYTDVAIGELFDAIDVDNSGCISEDDLDNLDVSDIFNQWQNKWGSWTS